MASLTILSMYVLLVARMGGIVEMNVVSLVDIALRYDQLVRIFQLDAPLMSMERPVCPMQTLPHSHGIL
jgi:hypothetical protein